MKAILVAVVVGLVCSSAACGGWYTGPTVGYSYYAPAVVPVYPPVVPYVTYSPVVPYVAYSPMVAPTVVVPVVSPVVVPPWAVVPPVVIGPTGKIYIPGRPVRNAVRAVLP